MIHTAISSGVSHICTDRALRSKAPNVIFSQACVILSTGGGLTPGLPPGGGRGWLVRYTPLVRHSLVRHPPRQTPPWSDTHPLVRCKREIIITCCQLTYGSLLMEIVSFILKSYPIFFIHIGQQLVFII